MSLRRSRSWIATVLIACACLPQAAFAQAGPPLITNDTGTPGDGHWEINLAATGDRSGGDWNVIAPDADINYGLGERIQLTVHPGWAHRSARDSALASGITGSEFALRWRFLDEDKAGVSMAIQPHWILSGPSAARRKDLSPATQEFVLPLQAVKTFGKSSAGVEVMRHFIEKGDDAWQAGMFWARPCPHAWQCLAEINSSRDDHGAIQTIVNLGTRHPLGEHLVFLASLGRQISGEQPRSSPVFYLGIQVLK
ncbi:MAG: hypothetical protein JF567_06160 [Xanthomonadales bacterium]|nr:hypothetical protein [Xanthomonadales bacterium]